MGRGWEGKQHGGKPSKYWQYWEGAWSNQRPRGQPDYQDRGSWDATAPAFPAYDARSQAVALAKTGKGAEGKGAPSLESWPDPADDLANYMQGHINHTRKAEQRVRALQKAKAQKDALWEKYQADMKKAYLREMTRHQKELARIEKELESAVEQREEARKEIRQAAARHAAGDDRPMEVENMDEEWQSMTNSWQQEHQEADGPHAVLRRALAGEQPHPQTSAPPPTMGHPSSVHPGAITTPEMAARLFMATMAGLPLSSIPMPTAQTMQVPQSVPAPVTAQQGAPPGAPTVGPTSGAPPVEVPAPFVPSPSSRQAEVPASSPMASKARQRTPRRPVKTAQVNPVHTYVPPSLGDKLAAKRQAMLASQDVKPELKEHVAQEGNMPSNPTEPTHSFLADDDSDLEVLESEQLEDMG